MEGKELPVSIDELAKIVVEKNASDLHITAGSPPAIRVDGKIIPLKQYPVLQPKDTQKLIYSIMSEKQRNRFEQKKELDFSFGIKVGSLTSALYTGTPLNVV